MGEETRSPEQRAAEAAQAAEQRTADAFERVVQRQAFGELLAMATENAVALAKLSSDAFDLVLRNLRVASRRDLTQLGRQLARSEDKIEQLLQEIEGLREDLDAERGGGPRRAGARGGGSAGSAGPGGSNGRGRSSGRGATRKRAAQK